MSTADADIVSIFAVLKARPNQVAALKSALQALIRPTRQEPGNTDYAIFQCRDAPDTFYVRESWRGQAGLDAHVALPHFQAFAKRMDELLAQPLELIYLDPVEP